MVSIELAACLSSLKTEYKQVPQGDHPVQLSPDYHQTYFLKEQQIQTLIYKLGLTDINPSDFAGIVKYAANEGWPVPEEKVVGWHEGEQNPLSANINTALAAMKFLESGKKK